MIDNSMLVMICVTIVLVSFIVCGTIIAVKNNDKK